MYPQLEGRPPFYTASKRKRMDPIEKEEAGKLEAILNAAQKKFGQFGLTKTTMNDIASEMGMGKASIYYYFPNKEALYEAVIVKEQDHFLQEIKKSVKVSASAVSLLRSYSKKRVALFENCYNLSKISSDALTSAVPCIKRLVTEFGNKETDLIASILELGIQNEEFKSIDAKEKADFIVTVLLGLRMVAKKQKDILEKEDYALLNKNMTHAMEMFIHSIQI